jgi:hypothetical protein
MIGRSAIQTHSSVSDQPVAARDEWPLQGEKIVDFSKNEHCRGPGLTTLHTSQERSEDQSVNEHDGYELIRFA